MAQTQQTQERTPEQQVRLLIAYDQLSIPVRSIDGKIERRSDKLAKVVTGLVDTGADFGNAVADVRYEEQQKARTLKTAVDEFCEQNPRAGSELQRLIAEKRAVKEVYLTYGLQQGSRLSARDYLAVMGNLGIEQARAEELYPVLLNVSRSLQKDRGRDNTTCDPREILVG